MNYSVEYDGIDIRKLSPGTRGIILLLLYLPLDDADERPLIIDPPEENLDPKAIYDELVGLFLKAKAKRQVIMVTHNANLVISTDADRLSSPQSSHMWRTCVSRTGAALADEARPVAAGEPPYWLGRSTLSPNIG